MLSPMRLADWFTETKKTQQWLADQVGVTQGRIAQIVGGAVPPLPLAAKIERATEARVTLRDFLPSEETAA
jgi:predicted transcriptional regulator